MRVLPILFLLSFSFAANSQSLDDKWVTKVNQSRNTDFDTFNLGLSQSADYVAIGTPAAILLAGFLKQDKYLQKEGLKASVAILGTYGVGYILKKTVKRERPYLVLEGLSPVQAKTSYSFPSGSAAVAFASATTLTSSFPKWYVAVPSFGYAAAVSYSRIRSGEHYPSDVLAGAIVGAGSVWVSKKLTHLINKN